ncbi:MAG: flavin monoamine oxidase family protein [Rhizobiaceae bacterium]
MQLSRRNALKLGIAATIATMARTAASNELLGKKVVVIGAGISGLAAAQELKRRGAEVIVLEAGDYIGGRIRTDMSLGAPFEHGAGWIHGPSANNPIRKLADQVGGRTFVTDDDSLEVFDGKGRPMSDSAWEKFDRLYERLEEKFFERDWGRDKRSIHQAIKDIDPKILKDPLGLWMLSAYTEFDLGGSIEDISIANAFQDEAFEGVDVILTQGYDKILAPLADGLDIRLNSPVSQIAYNSAGVSIDGMNADFAVCSVPLGVLKAGTIAFYPDLPSDIQAAIDNVGFGAVTKIAMKFDEPFWDLDTQYFGVMTKPMGRWNYWMNYRKFSDQNILLGLSFGQYAPVADKMTDAEMTQDAMDVLRSVWGNAVGKPSAIVRTGWTTDPHFRGAYSYPQAGGTIAQFEIFQKPIANRILMAGEHTIFDYHSTTHGALLSGQRAARAIVELAG